MRERGHLCENALAFATSDRCPHQGCGAHRERSNCHVKRVANREIKAQRMHQRLFAGLFVADAPR
jgi:hypothetical protein